MIGHILRQDRDDNSNVAISCLPEGQKKRGKAKTTWRRTAERGRKVRLGLIGGNKGVSGQPGKVEMLCEGPMCHKVRGGWVTQGNTAYAFSGERYMLKVL